MKIKEWFRETDYINKFKKYGVHYRKYPELDLMIIKRKYGSEYSENKFWLNYCRGLILNYKTNEVIFIPPVKAKEYLLIEELSLVGGTQKPLVDGTMVNLFYYRDQWITSTRSNIGATNKWSSDKNFHEMFIECSSDIDYNTLNTSYTYSFVMRHKKNRLTSIVSKNELVLVDVYDKHKQLSELPKMNGYTTVDTWEPGTLIKGITVRKNNKRYKWLTPEHKFIEMIKPNTNNPCLNYLTLRNSGHLTEYLKYFPENRFEYTKYRDKIHKITKIIYQCYVGVFIRKTLDKELVPFHLKPLLYEIHKIYLTTKQGISWETVKNYIYELEPTRLYLIINNL